MKIKVDQKKFYSMSYNSYENRHKLEGYHSIISEQEVKPGDLMCFGVRIELLDRPEEEFEEMNFIRVFVDGYKIVDERGYPDNYPHPLTFHLYNGGKEKQDYFCFNRFSKPDTFNRFLISPQKLIELLS